MFIIRYTFIGHRIVGVEYDEKVVKELFEESQIEVAEVKEMGGLKLYSSADGRCRLLIVDEKCSILACFFSIHRFFFVLPTPLQVQGLSRGFFPLQEGVRA